MSRLRSVTTDKHLLVCETPQSSIRYQIAKAINFSYQAESFYNFILWTQFCPQNKQQKQLRLNLPLPHSPTGWLIPSFIFSLRFLQTKLRSIFLLRFLSYVIEILRNAGGPSSGHTAVFQYPSWNITPQNEVKSTDNGVAEDIISCTTWPSLWHPC